MLWVILSVTVAVAAWFVADRFTDRSVRRRAARFVERAVASYPSVPGPPAPRSRRVRVTDESVEVGPYGRRRERLEWSRLHEVAVRTTPAGPWQEDAFLLLGDDTGKGIVVPLEDAAEILPHLQRLPGFDNDTFLRAVASTADELFVCWRRHH